MVHNIQRWQKKFLLTIKIILIMKKIFYGLLFAVSALALSVFSTKNSSDDTLIGLQLENVFALAADETDYSIACSTKTSGDTSTMNVLCSDCAFHWGYKTGDNSRCTPHR